MPYSPLRISTLLALSTVGVLTGCQSTSEPGSDTTALERSDTALETDLSSFPAGTIVDSYGDAVLSELDTASGTVHVLRVVGTPAEMGYQYGRLVGDRIPDAWNALMSYLGEEAGGLSAAQAERVIAPLLDRAYQHLDPYMPSDLRDELQAISDGATDAGVTYRSQSVKDILSILKYVIALTNVSDLNAFGEGGKAVAKMLATGTSAELDAFVRGQGVVPNARTPESNAARMLGRTCSFFATWGPRTEAGGLFASRNLDWSSDTGINDVSLITIYVPTDGLAYATFGYVGVIGALAGMNERGVLVSEVGSTSVLEKLTGEPWTIRNREILAKAADLDQAIPYMVNSAPDRNRPTTLGYNFLLGYGDPLGGGANASAAAFETNGGVVTMFHRGPAADSCRETPTLYTYDREGRIASTSSYGSSAEVNVESTAYEIDADANIRLFKVENGVYVRDAEGYLIEDPYYGQPLRTGKYLSCAIYRGDEAIGYGTRRWQTASNGPSGDDPREVMNDSGSFNGRYSVMNGILEALWSGAAYSHDGVEWVSAGAAMRTVGMDEATDLARAAAMDSNILSVVYDATTLKARLAYESGTGSSWVRASDSDYTDVDLAALFGWQ